jgi:hypothetical protein
MVGVRFPVRYKTINQNKVAISIVAASVLLGFAGRIHYCLLNALQPRIDNVTNATLYTFGYSEFSDGDAYAYWTMVSDVIMPFAMMAAMCSMSFVTGLTVVSRYLKKKKTQVAVNPQTAGQAKFDQQADQMRTATQLLLVSTGLCILNQVGQMCYTISWQIFDGTNHDFKATYAEIEMWVHRRWVYNQIYIFQGLTENVSRVMHFYMYVLISSSFRNEFLRIFKFWGKNESMQQSNSSNKSTGSTGARHH